MQSPEILAAVQNGRHHRIGFAVYLWADGDCPMVIDWRIIASAEDAVAMAADLSANAEAARQAKTGSLTGLSRGMNCGLTVLQSSPFVADRMCSILFLTVSRTSPLRTRCHCGT